MKIVAKVRVLITSHLYNKLYINPIYEGRRTLLLTMEYITFIKLIKKLEKVGEPERTTDRTEKMIAKGGVNSPDKIQDRT